MISTSGPSSPSANATISTSGPSPAVVSVAGTSTVAVVDRTDSLVDVRAVTA
jgi:hypothetical protein